MRRAGAGRELIGGKWREKHKQQSRADEDKHKTGVEERRGGKKGQGREVQTREETHRRETQSKQKT